MTWAFGKVILLGEHAVVHGQPALAGALDCRLSCALTRRAHGPLRVRVPAWGLDVDSAAEHPLAEALRALIACMDAGDVAADIDVDTRLPPAAGLGSSAALAVALVRTLARCQGQTLADHEIEAAAASAERCFHDNPSGVDVALATRGGLGVYVRGQGLRRIHAPPVAVAIGMSGQARRTADMVARVAAALSSAPAITRERLEALGAAARAGEDAVVHGDTATLGALMARAHEILAALGVSTPALDALCAIARDAGALGAKLTGAGGGGAVVAVAPDPDRADAVLAAWRARGFDGFLSTAGVSP